MNQSLPELEKKCDFCLGEGKRADMALEEGFYDCPQCGGSGFVPTHEGKQILELMRHNSRLDISARLAISGV